MSLIDYECRDPFERIKRKRREIKQNIKTENSDNREDAQYNVNDANTEDDLSNPRSTRRQSFRTDGNKENRTDNEVFTLNVTGNMFCSDIFSF